MRNRPARSPTLLLVLLGFMPFGTIGCQSSGTPGATDDPPVERPDRRTLVSDPQLEVSVEVDGGRHAHPRTIPPRAVERILGNIYFEEWIHRRHQETRRVFDRLEVLRLKNVIADAFLTLAPDERLAFRLVSDPRPSEGTEPLLTSGVLFVSRGALHLVLANCHVHVGGRGAMARERTGDPTAAGPPAAWRLVAQDGQELGGPPGDRVQAHWLVIDLARFEP